MFAHDSRYAVGSGIIVKVVKRRFVYQDSEEGATRGDSTSLTIFGSGDMAGGLLEGERRSTLSLHGPTNTSNASPATIENP
jgi:hypothetical protein